MIVNYKAIVNRKNMFIEMLKTKIHRATVTGADLNYSGSLTLDENLMKHSKNQIYRFPVFEIVAIAI